MRLAIVSLLALMAAIDIWGFPESARAQGKMPLAQTTDLAARAASGEASKHVLTSQGDVVPPWTRKRACRVAEGVTACSEVLFNPTTGEIARFGETWASGFASTGNGQEVLRAVAMPSGETASAQKR
jgi:hypothetical protein